MLPPIDEQRWHLPTPLHGLAAEPLATLASCSGLDAALIAVLLRRGHGTTAAIAALLEPPSPPPALDHFKDLDKAVGRLRLACAAQEALAVCGDYDADGMTSTALLVGVLQRLGAKPVAAIPSRMDDGYGLNCGMVERLAEQGIRLLITVDNGVSAEAALLRAQALGVDVILTDHHTLPEQVPPQLALLHPAVTPEGSPYRGLAGVGLAYVLARALCESLNAPQGLEIALNLFCIGTIADMAPLQGVNRRWLIDGLPRLAASPLPGLQALLQLSGLDGQPVDAQTVSFQLAPRINAVGRLGDPALVVELLTTDCPSRALELARQCEQLNRQRRELCDAIEAEALALLEADGQTRSPFVLIAQNHWHHGVIGIVAARLVERFGLPVALAAGEGQGRLRASVRAPRGFAVDAALRHCSSHLERFGGHPAAGGFTLQAQHLSALHTQLNALAEAWIQQQGRGIPVEPEALLRFEQIDLAFWQDQQRLGPYGVGHPTPLFWSQRCQVLQQTCLRGGHLQLQLAQGDHKLRAIGWRWQGAADLPDMVDVAYHLVRDDWQGRQRLQLELVGLRPSADIQSEVVLLRQQRRYRAQSQGTLLVIRNDAGQELQAELDGIAQLQHPYLRRLFSDAALALGLSA